MQLATSERKGFPPHADRFARHGIDLVGLLAGGESGQDHGA
ncbi:MAG TPA: hypothetical protein VIW24_26505 [Aldersonia sp.]